MTEAKSAAGLIDHVLRKHGFYSKAECADIPGTIGADLIAVVLSYAAERERLLLSEIENLRCDADNDASKLAAYKRGIAERHELLRAAVEWFEAHRPVAGPGTLPTWYSDASARLSSGPATEGKREDD